MIWSVTSSYNIILVHMKIYVMVQWCSEFGFKSHLHDRNKNIASIISSQNYFKNHMLNSSCFVLHSITFIQIIYFLAETSDVMIIIGIMVLSRIVAVMVLCNSFNDGIKVGGYHNFYNLRANLTAATVHCRTRLFHSSTHTTSRRCFILDRTIHDLWNLYGNPYKSRAEKEEETVTW